MIRPIAFASRTLQTHEKNYGISEIERLRVVWAIKHFQYYIYGHHCKVYTDLKALKALLNTLQSSEKLARMKMALQELDLQIKYRPGRTNTQADTLSHYPESLLQDDVVQTQAQPLVAAVKKEHPEVAEDGKESNTGTLGQRQRHNPELADIINY